MLSIESSDFQAMDDFSLRWRWTDARWNLLAAEDLAGIRPLTMQKAAELDNEFQSLVEPARLRIVGNTYSSLRSVAASRPCATYNTSGDIAATQDWLRATLPVHDGDAFISWNDETAALARLAVFVQYWDDFCYPLSYDVVVIPPTAEWVLYYFHEETFFFWMR
jgi:hypothetical protein